MKDQINPRHYTSHPSGVECIQVTEHYDFCTGNAIKYLWRAGLKTEGEEGHIDAQIRDLKKAEWYINRKIRALESQKLERTLQGDS